MTITAAQALKRYGPPEREAGMVLFKLPAGLAPATVPRAIYCNRDLVGPLRKAFSLIQDRGLGQFIKTWDGCFNIRNKRGGSSLSLHAWGLAIDTNATGNRQGQTPTMSPALVRAFKDAGFEWGGDWNKPDGMHFQLAAWPAP
jgi:hypothetical protein